MRKAIRLLMPLVVGVSIAATASGQEPVAPAEGTAQPAAPAEQPAAGPDSATYDLQLRELEDRLNELREDVFASKARLRMLWHNLMQENIGGSRVVIDHVNELGGLFEIVRVSYALDGNLIFTAAASDVRELNGRRPMEIHAEPVVAGPHTLVIQAEVRGDPHGMFSYMTDYEYSMGGAYSFTVDDGKTAAVEVFLVDRGGSSRELTERLDFSYAIELSDTVEEGVGAAEGEGGDAR